MPWRHTFGWLSLRGRCASSAIAARRYGTAALTTYRAAGWLPVCFMRSAMRPPPTTTLPCAGTRRCRVALWRVSVA
eukprot:2175349-Prorocentrum_lima.AAC.1